MGPDLKQTKKSVISTNQNKAIVGQDNGVQRNMEIDIDVAQCIDHGEVEVIDVECQDSTEYSSSFGNTDSGDNNGLVVNEDDVEVESKLSEFDTSFFRPLFDESLMMGRRRLTDHWKKFAHPLVWRCKWLEVKLRELKSQQLNYERELAEYGQSKKIENEMVNFEGFDASSKAFPSETRRKEVMQRKKRRQEECATDVASYMSQHPIFSYKRNRKPVVAAYDDWGDLDNKTINDCYDIGCNGGGPSLQSRDADGLLRQILPKIEVLRSRIQELKTRINKVMIENPQKFSPINLLSPHVPCDVLNDSGKNSYPYKGDRNSSQCTTSQHASEHDMWDSFMPGNVVSGHEEVTPFPDMIRSMSQRLLEISAGNIEGEILIPNQATVELNSFGSAIIQLAEKPHLSMEELETVMHVQPPLDNLHVNTCLQSNAQPPFPQSKQPDNKKTNGVQKSGLGRWSRRSSG